MGESIRSMQLNLVTRAERDKVRYMLAFMVYILTNASSYSTTTLKQSAPQSNKTKPKFLISFFHLQVDFASLKQTLELSEKTDFVNLKAENERLLGDIERLKQRLREEITRTQAGVRLDLNLEKVNSFYTISIPFIDFLLFARVGFEMNYR